MVVQVRPDIVHDRFEQGDDLILLRTIKYTVYEMRKHLQKGKERIEVSLDAYQQQDYQLLVVHEGEFRHVAVL